MLTSISRNSSWTSVVLVALAAALLVTVQDANAAQPKHLSKKEVVALITTAKSPEDHLQLARYYKAEADRLEVEAKDHEELAEAYRKSTASQAAAMKSPMAPNTAAHCEYFAKSVREAANAAREMSTSHEQMAKDAAANRKYGDSAARRNLFKGSSRTGTLGGPSLLDTASSWPAKSGSTDLMGASSRSRRSTAGVYHPHAACHPLGAG